MPTDNFASIPNELKELKQWCLWKYEDVGAIKPTKVPYDKEGHKLSVIDPSHWIAFSDVVSVYRAGGYDGIGFIFTQFDPYAFIDLDATDDKEHSERQLKIFKEFDSYSEKSPSGKGLHIIVKGSIAQGRKRADVEIYSSGRYATMTGNSFHLKPIEERHDLLNQLYEQMAGPAQTVRYTGNEPERQDDKEVLETARRAVNGSKFIQLYTGEWQSLYSSQSEADFALIDMFAFYTQNRLQINRLFLASSLGQRDKAKRRDYVDGMITRSFDRLLPKMDFDGFRIQLESKLDDHKGNNNSTLFAINNNISSNNNTSTDYDNRQDAQLALPLAVSDNGSPTAFDAVSGGSNPSTATNNGSVAQRLEPSAHNGLVAGSNPAASTNNQSTTTKLMPSSEPGIQSAINPPPGLVGEIAQFIYQAAPRPVPEIAIAAGLGLMAGICGRAYNVSGTGLNQYILCLAMTGAGKEAMASGIDKLINAVQLSVPVASEFIGPSEIASGQALIKYLANKSQSFVSILGEFGLRLRSMSSERANGAEIALRRMLLDLYNKSGYGQVARPSIYADSEKNTNLIVSPAFSILGESTPERFYDILNEEMISEGLLPRFMLIEYNGARPKLNENAMSVQPPDWLVSKISTLMANAKTVMNQRKVIEVGFSNDAGKMLKEFDKLADSKINSTDKEIIRQLWNRAHIKVLKISALIAVGIHPFNPIISVDDVVWAKQIVINDVRALSDKFETGMIGKSSDELKQIEDMRRMIKRFVSEPWDVIHKYCDDQRLHSSKIIPASYLSRRLYAMSSYRNDKIGSANALKRTIQNLVDGDYLREVPSKEMIEKFGNKPKAFIVTNAQWVLRE